MHEITASYGARDTCKLTAEEEGWIVGPDPVGSVGGLLVNRHRLLPKVAVRNHLKRRKKGRFSITSFHPIRVS